MGIDNITVVKRLTKDKIDDLDDDSHDPTDYDLWQESMSLIDKLQTTVTTMHVKAHQDDLLKKDFGGVGPMKRDAHYNIIVDKIAEIKRETLQICSNTIPAPSIKAAITIRGNIVTSNTIRHIEHELTGKPLIAYLIRQNKWTEPTFHTIDWDAHNRYLTKLPYLKTIKVVKYIHNWQNTTGAQKELFDKHRDEPEHQQHEYMCPMKCGCHETAQHFLRCEKINSSAETSRVLKSLRKWFANANTNQVLTTTLMHCIREWLQFGNEPNTNDLDISNERNYQTIMQAIEAQSEIGWDQFFKGRIALQWGDIQQKHYDYERSQPSHNLKKYHDRQWWTANIIKQIVYVALNAWQIRNDKLHEDKKKNKYNAERDELLNDVKKWYDCEGEFDDNDHYRYFSKSYIDRKIAQTQH